jgi:glucose/arabinose dehydrogenase
MSRLRGRRIAKSIVAVATLALSVAACSSDRPDAGGGGGGPAVTFATTPATTPATPPGRTDNTASSTDSSAASTVSPGTNSTTNGTSPEDPAIALHGLGTFDLPVDAAWRSGDDTMFVVQQDGLIVPLRGETPGTPVLDITSLTSADGERGLLGLTFSPDGSLAYVDYTDNDGNTVIAEYGVGADGTFDTGASRALLAIEQPYPNHNGGNVTIGPDGYLYVGMGDGGAANDPERRALDLGSLLGKILRIDPSPGDGHEYSIPPDNPFVDVQGARPEIWAVGVRNPWRMSFDSATGDLCFGDVGQDTWEEVDVAWADEGAGRGRNFGWSAWEATHRFNDDVSPDGATPPVFEYQHGDAGCSISGGAVYRGSAIPALTGWYVFNDYCSGIITGVLVHEKVFQRSLKLGNHANGAAVRAGPDGELYVLSLGGEVARIVPA